MVQIAANLSTLFGEAEFLDRFDLAAAHGFSAVEFWYPYAYDTATIAERARRNGLTILGFNTDCGDESNGDWGLSVDPGRVPEGRRAIDRAIEVARALDVHSIHVMSGIVPQGVTLADCERTYVEHLRYAAGVARKYDITVLIEALSPQSRPGYLVSTQEKADELRAATGCDNVKLQFDVFHTQLSEGNLENLIRRYYPHIGHIQIASAPLRREPDEGEIDYRWILGLLDELGWDAPVAAEYFPRTTTAEGLRWLTEFGIDIKGEVNV